MDSEEELYLQLWLAKHGYEPEISSKAHEEPTWRYPMDKAAEEGNIRILRLIKERGMDKIGGAEAEKETTFRLALTRSNVATVSYLARDWDLFPSNLAQYASLLQVAMQFSHKEVLEWLMEEGVRRGLQVSAALDHGVGWPNTRPASQIACMLGNVEKLVLCVKYGVNLNQTLPNDSMMDLVIQSGNLDCVKYLMSINVPLHHADNYNYATSNVLIRAVRSGSVEMVDWIFKQSGRPWGTLLKFNALIEAAKCGSLPVVQYLVRVAKSKVDPYGKQREMMSPLFVAVRHGHLDVVKWLHHEAGAKLDAFFTGVPVLTMAMHADNNEETIRWLIKMGAEVHRDKWYFNPDRPDHSNTMPNYDVFSSDSYQPTREFDSDRAATYAHRPPLCEAIRLNKPSYVHLLLQHNAPLFGTREIINQCDPETLAWKQSGYTAIFTAVSSCIPNGHGNSMLKFLLEGDLVPSIGPTSERIKAIHQLEERIHQSFFLQACHSGLLDSVKYLHSLGMNSSTHTDPNGDYAIHVAARNNNIELAHFLVTTCQVDPNLLNSSGMSSIMIACISNNEAIVKYLISRGCQIDAVETCGVPFEKLQLSSSTLWLSSTSIINYMIYEP